MDILKIAEARPLFRYHVFISYQLADFEAAKALTHALQDIFGLRAWLDLDPGEHDRAPRKNDDIRGKRIAGDDHEIHKALDEAIFFSILVAVLSSASVAGSLWVRKEIVIAERREKPLFFWHLAEKDNARAVSSRRGGGIPSSESAGAFIESVARHNRRELLATTESADFMRELSALDASTIVGHTIGPPSNVQEVAFELNALVELSELILSRGETVNAKSIQQFWPEYERLNERNDRLIRLIEERHGKRISVGRAPVFDGFRLKRPFVEGKSAHLERILEDERYRHAEFQKLAGESDR